MHVVVLRVRAERQGAARRRKVQGIVQQIAQGLAQQERLAVDLHIASNRLFHLQAGAFDARTLRREHVLDHRRQRDVRLFFQALALLHLRQVQQALDQLLQARAFAVDIADKPLLLLTRSTYLQEHEHF